MTTPTREQVAFTAHLTHWDKSYPIRFDDFSAGYNAARSDLEATIAEQAETLLKIKIQFEDALLYLKRHIPIPAQFTEALSLHPSPEILAARD